MIFAQTVVLSLVTGFTFAVQETPPTTTPETPKAVDPQAVEKAEQLIAEVVATYRSATALTDTIRMSMETPLGEQTETMEVTIGSGTDARVAVTGMTMIALNKSVFITRDDVANKFVKVDLDNDLMTTANSLFGEGGFLLPQFALRSQTKMDQWLGGMTMGMLKSPQITGLSKTKIDNGTEQPVISLTAENGSADVMFNSATKLVEEIKLTFTPVGAPAGFEMKSTFALAPAVHSVLPTPIAFDPGDRTAVKTLSDLEPKPVQAGAVAPDFSLKSLDGKTVTLSDLKGSIVVLDFWATWCGPCRRALPLLQEFTTWAAENDQPVNVYTVNVLERGIASEADLKTKVSEFWKKQKFTMPVLLDADNSVWSQYGFSGIPVTIVVGTDGKVFRVHNGFNPEMVDELKEDVEDALETDD